MKSISDLKQRYAETPLLRFLDAYVLWAIDALPEDQEKSLQEITPKLQQIWNRTEERWYEVVESQMQFPATMPQSIRNMWKKNQAIAAANDVELPPVDFAWMFVDRNFNPMTKDEKH